MNARFGGRVLAVLLALLPAASPHTARGATFIVPEDRVLIEHADAVLVGSVERSWAVRTDGGGVYSLSEVLVAEVMKGDLNSGDIITLRESGGHTATISLLLHGVPRYEAGETVMLLLSHDEQSGLWRTYQYALGKFTFSVDSRGRDVVIRDRDNICGWDPEFRPYEERARLRDPFLKYVRAVANGEDLDVDYYVEDGACEDSQGATSPATSEIVASKASDYLSFCSCRWNNGASARFETGGNQTGYSNSRADASTGIAAWNNHSESTIGYSLGGTAAGSQAFVTFDGINSILFDDPAYEVNGAGCFNGFGTIAMGGPWFSSSQTHSFGGETFKNIGGADLVVDCGVNPTNGITQAEFQAVLAHELGHTLGVRHSNETDCVGCDYAASALMASTLGNGPGNASLMEWDRRAAKTAYGQEDDSDDCQYRTISCGQTVSGTIDHTDCKTSGGHSLEFWSFRATEGQRLTIDMTSNTLRPYLHLTRPDRSLAAESSNGRITFTADQTGTWWIQTTSWIVGDYGDFLLSLSCTSTSTSHTLTVTKNGTGSGTVSSNPAGISCGMDCSHDYAAGSTVTLTATPSAGSTFAGWGSACSGTSSCSLVMTADKVAVATFYGSTMPGCTPTSTTACMLNKRFKITVRYRNQFDNGVANADAWRKNVTGFANPNYETAFFYFNNENNIELMVKMLDQGNTDSAGRPTIAVLTGSATPLRIEVTIEDTKTGATKKYTSEFAKQVGQTDFTAFLK